MNELTPHSDLQYQPSNTWQACWEGEALERAVRARHWSVQGGRAVHALERAGRASLFMHRSVLGGRVCSYIGTCWEGEPVYDRPNSQWAYSITIGRDTSMGVLDYHWKREIHGRTRLSLEERDQWAYPIIIRRDQWAYSIIIFEAEDKEEDVSAKQIEWTKAELDLYFNI